MVMGGFHLFRLPEDEPSIPLPFKSSNLSPFVIPSGSYLRVDAKPECPLKFEDFLVDTLAYITPTEAELKDQGKSDALTKLIVLVQTLWFVVQCIARGKQQLPLTELEVVTLAYTMLNFFIYVFWWDKPRNVECPIRIYKQFGASHEEAGEKAKEWDEDWVWLWFEKIMDYTIGAQDDYIILSNKHSIPMFWSGRPDNYRGIGSFFASILGAGFGAIHCIAWSSEFPSRAELVLWRASCVAMISIPSIVIMAYAFGRLSEVNEKYSWWWVQLAGMCGILLVLSAWLYIASRIATLVISFTTLRSLPPHAFSTVDWTTFIPHI